LFDECEVEVPSLYDPYRNYNILKSCHKVNKAAQPRFAVRVGNPVGKKAGEGEQNRSPSNRRSLKKLLRQLEADPCPEPRYRRKWSNPKFKTIGIMSST
jgi:hypothetical protein